MTTLSSEVVEINKTPENIFGFISNFNNFGTLMPQQVVNYSCTETECQFTIQGMGGLGLKHAEKRPFSFLSMTPSGKVPFDFTLETHIEPSGTGSKVQLKMLADMNPFVKMMAEKPLTNFLNMLISKLKEI